MNKICVLQSEIWMADLEPVQGSEQGGKRPVLVVSGNSMNESLPVVIVCMLSGKVKGFPCCPVISPTKSNGLKSTSEVLVFQIRTISKQRLNKKIGLIKQTEFAQILQGLHEVLVY